MTAWLECVGSRGSGLCVATRGGLPPGAAPATRPARRLGAGGRAVVAGLALTVSGLLQGCETYSTSHAETPLASGAARVLALEPCIDRTGLQIERDLAADATGALRKAIRESAIFTLDADAPMRLGCDIEGFLEGSAFKRWLLPGWGETSGQLKVAVAETDGGAILATFQSKAQVSAGGLYTIGADQYIFDVAARDIVRQLEGWAGRR